MTDAEHPSGGIPGEIVGQEPLEGKEISPFDLQKGDVIIVYDESDSDYKREGTVVSVPQRPETGVTQRIGSVLLQLEPTDEEKNPPTVILPAGTFHKKNYGLTDSTGGLPPSSPSHYRFVLLERNDPDTASDTE